MAFSEVSKLALSSLYDVINGVQFGRQGGAIMRLQVQPMNKKGKWERVTLDTQLGWPDKTGLYIIHRADGWVDFPAQTRDYVSGHPDAEPKRKGTILEYQRFPLLGCHDTVRETLEVWAYAWWTKDA
jgi:hypothetical protein